MLPSEKYFAKNLVEWHQNRSCGAKMKAGSPSLVKTPSKSMKAVFLSPSATSLPTGICIFLTPHCLSLPSLSVSVHVWFLRFEIKSWQKNRLSQSANCIYRSTLWYVLPWRYKFLLIIWNLLPQCGPKAFLKKLNNLQLYENLTPKAQLSIQWTFFPFGLKW